MNKVYTSLILVFGLVVLWTLYLTNVKEDENLTVRYYTIKELTMEDRSISKVKVGGLIKFCCLAGVKPHACSMDLSSRQLGHPQSLTDHNSAAH